MTTRSKKPKPTGAAPAAPVAPIPAPTPIVAAVPAPRVLETPKAEVEVGSLAPGDSFQLDGRSCRREGGVGDEVVVLQIGAEGGHGARYFMQADTKVVKT